MVVNQFIFVDELYYENDIAHFNFVSFSVGCRRGLVRLVVGLAGALEAALVAHFRTSASFGRPGQDAGRLRVHRPPAHNDTILNLATPV